MLEVVDTHCHLTNGALAGRALDSIDQAVKAGVTRMVNVACVPGEWDAALDLARRSPHLRTGLGIHPHDAAQTTPAHWERLAELWRTPGVVACGEMGLDYHYDFSPRDVQRGVFAKQLELARQAALPLIVHCRNAHEDTVRILLDEGFANAGVVFHCFSGNRHQAAEIRSHGWWTSFTGTITFRKSGEQQQVCLETPADQLMFETDAPYLSPEPVRAVRPNVPANVLHTIRFAATLRGESFEQLAATSMANACRFFRMKN